MPGSSSVNRSDFDIAIIPICLAVLVRKLPLKDHGFWCPRAKQRSKEFGLDAGSATDAAGHVTSHQFLHLGHADQVKVAENGVLEARSRRREIERLLFALIGA